MSGIKIKKWNMRGFQQIRRDPGVTAMVDEQAAKAAAAAGDGFVVSGRQGRTRYRAIVYPDSYMAVKRELRDNRLLAVATSMGMKIGGGS